MHWTAGKAPLRIQEHRLAPCEGRAVVSSHQQKASFQKIMARARDPVLTVLS